MRRIASWKTPRGSLGGVLTAHPHALTSCPGIGRRTAGALAAAGALTRRLEAEQAGKERLQVTCPEDVAKAYGPDMRGLSREVFKVVLLNTANVAQGDYTVSTGGLAASIVEPRGVFQEAILRDAAAVVCLHNHPSGNPEPSREDEKITRQLAEGGELLGIPVHDHLIIAGRGYTSLAERGIL